ncbi:hypothetical protein RHOFW104T7_15970 [Rhodanobacter thiooxydans]|uniref:Uncharacterized protein n=1 Tax=Rhodanobacter thiooxydans TaxID=416169 RepID=A0A154QFN7_9GAMM|nr:hypothetical protein [Rhodanobacter thiooxydans]EIL98133.1 hypothetical protein UUA_12610 [Rhodanobacter thiooxydans LCS2]KZC23040.1 hypothetical protein RHOFW104T7_15970 [Rhodanobacter thiooxydans]MCW0203007.1 hypothetical protein [Rhodanobacter thiooxydans]
MPRSRLLLLLLLPMLLLTMAFRQTPLVDPPPIDVPAGLTAVQVSKAVKGALIGRTWVVTAEHADGIDAALNGNDYQAKIHVAFDTHQVKISYVDSTNLKYKVKKDGTRLIHTNYMNWMRYLSGDIGRDLQLISAGAESTPMASPGG